MPLCWLVLSVGYYTANSQTDRLFFNHLTQSDGLSQTTNNVVFKDSRGFVWIGSINGLNRYDGRQIKVYKYRQDDPNSLPDNYIQSRIIEDEKGDLWFSTHEALVRYVRKDDHFVRHAFPGMNGYRLAFQDDKKRLALIVGDSNFYFYVPASRQWIFQHHLPAGMQRVVPQFAKDGTLKRLVAFSYDHPGIYFLHYEANGTLAQTVRFNGANGEPAIRPSDILVERDSVAWVAAREGFLTLSLDNANDWHFQATPDWQANDLGFYQNNQLLTALTGGGWMICDKNNLVAGKRYFHEPGNPWSLSTNKLTGIRADNHGVIWAGASGIGVDFSQPKKVKFKSLNVGRLWGIPGPPTGIFALAEDSAGNTWCSTRGSGIFSLSPDKKPLVHYSRDNKNGNTLPFNDVPYLFFDNKNRCWAFGFSGLGLLEPGRKSFRPVASGTGFLHGIELKNEQGLLFSSMSGGLYKVIESGSEVSFQRVQQQDISGAYTYLFQSKQGLLFACRDLSAVEIRRPENHFALDTTLPIKGDVHCFYEEEGTNFLWIATGNGLVKLDQNTWEWQTFTEADGLPDQHIYAVMGDEEGRLWLTTNRGIVLFFQDEKRFHSFDLPDGQQGLEFNSHSFLRRTNGEFWFGGMNGINHFFPDSIQFIQDLPQVQFTRLLVNEEEPSKLECDVTGATNISEVVKLVFAPDQNTLSFEFAALEFSYPAKNAFQYMMENYDADWVQAGTRGFARYANLPPGDYSFWVKASNSDGIWSQPKELKIVVQKPFYLRWWFICLVLAGLLLAGYGIYRYRVNQLLRLERLRVRIASDLHDDIGATLSNINILTTLIQQKVAKDSDAQPLLARIEEEVQASAESLDDIIWSINPQNDPLDRVLARMRRFAGEVFEAKGIVGEMQFPPEAKRLRLDMDKRRQFYLFFKEAINNLAKYAGCKNALIHITYGNGRLAASIEDDGVGFDTAATNTGGNGLLTMRQRAKNLKGEFSIRSAPGQGTKVSISFPVTEISD